MLLDATRRKAADSFQIFNSGQSFGQTKKVSWSLTSKTPPSEKCRVAVDLLPNIAPA
jgi:hypothetical protein